MYIKPSCWTIRYLFSMYWPWPAHCNSTFLACQKACLCLVCLYGIFSYSRALPVECNTLLVHRIQVLGYYLLCWNAEFKDLRSDKHNPISACLGRGKLLFWYEHSCSTANLFLHLSSINFFLFWSPTYHPNNNCYLLSTLVFELLLPTDLLHDCCL